MGGATTFQVKNKKNVATCQSGVVSGMKLARKVHKRRVEMKRILKS